MEQNHHAGFVDVGTGFAAALGWGKRGKDSEKSDRNKLWRRGKSGNQG